MSGGPARPPAYHGLLRPGRVRRCGLIRPGRVRRCGVIRPGRVRRSHAGRRPGAARDDPAPPVGGPAGPDTAYDGRPGTAYGRSHASPGRMAAPRFTGRRTTPTLRRGLASRPGRGGAARRFRPVRGLRACRAGRRRLARPTPAGATRFGAAGTARRGCGLRCARPVRSALCTPVRAVGPVHAGGTSPKRARRHARPARQGTRVALRTGPVAVVVGSTSARRVRHTVRLARSASRPLGESGASDVRPGVPRRPAPVNVRS
jgi:hypothetical protein